MLLIPKNNRLYFPLFGHAFAITAIADNVADASRHMEHTGHDAVIAEVCGLVIMVDRFDVGRPLNKAAPFTQLVPTEADKAPDRAEK